MLFVQKRLHLSANCTYSWITPIVRRTQTDETENIEIDDDASFKTKSIDSFKWADDQDLSDDEGEALDENIPLISAIADNAEPQPSQHQLPPPDEFSAADNVSTPAPTDLSTSPPVTDLTETPALPLLSNWPIASLDHPTPNQVSSQSTASPDSQPSQHVLDSEGFVRPLPPENPTHPSSFDLLIFAITPLGVRFP